MILQRILTFLFIFTITSNVFAQKDCKKFLLRADKCVSKILIITNSDLDKFESKESLVKNYCE